VIAVALAMLLWQYAPWRAPDRAAVKPDSNLKLEQQLDLKRSK
jgi:hypothetical protein